MSKDGFCEWRVSEQKNVILKTGIYTRGQAFMPGELEK
jgi:hypothetical protein